MGITVTTVKILFLLHYKIQIFIQGVQETICFPMETEVVILLLGGRTTLYLWMELLESIMAPIILVIIIIIRTTAILVAIIIAIIIMDLPTLSWKIVEQVATPLVRIRTLVAWALLLEALLRIETTHSPQVRTAWATSRWEETGWEALQAAPLVPTTLL